VLQACFVWSPPSPHQKAGGGGDSEQGPALVEVPEPLFFLHEGSSPTTAAGSGAATDDTLLLLQAALLLLSSGELGPPPPLHRHQLGEAIGSGPAFANSLRALRTPHHRAGFIDGRQLLGREVLFKESPDILRPHATVVDHLRVELAMACPLPPSRKKPGFSAP